MMAGSSLAAPGEGARAGVPPGTTSLAIALIKTVVGDVSGRFLEWSDLTGAIGFEPLSTPPRTVLRGTLAYNPPSLAAGAYTPLLTVPVPGAEVGDHVISVEHGTATLLVWEGKVTAPDTVTCWGRVPPVVAGPLDGGLGTLTARVSKAYY